MRWNARTAGIALVCLLAPVLMGAGDVLPRHVLPDPRLTPGHLLRGISVGDLCGAGRSLKPRRIEEADRQAVFRAYGLPGGDHTGFCAGPHGCVLDRLIGIGLGGSDEPRNLWPEPNDGPWNAGIKATLDKRLHALVCSGRLPLALAQRAVASDWITAWHQYVGDAPPPAATATTAATDTP